MVTPESIVIRPAGRLCHDEASRLATLVAASKARTVIIDMTRVTEATTPGLARLVLVRRTLLQAKRDVRLAGLNGQPARLLEVHRLQEILPVIHQLPASSIIEPAADFADRAKVSGNSRCRHKEKPALVTTSTCWTTAGDPVCCA
jgi:anti-anti-sigma regulatory factor